MKMKSWICRGAVGAALALAALTGCSDAVDEAAVGQISQASTTCVVESCQAPTPYFNQDLCACAPCELDAHCPAGATCDAAGQCVATLECESLADCAEDEVCEAGSCREAITTDGVVYSGEPLPDTCNPNTGDACPPGEVCNEETLLCEYRFEACTADTCHPELTCASSGFCAGCTGPLDARCGDGNICFNGICLVL